MILQDPLPRMRRRKSLPEKLPPMMSPIKSLFGRRTNAGLMLGLPATRPQRAACLGSASQVRCDASWTLQDESWALGRWALKILAPE